MGAPYIQVVPINGRYYRVRNRDIALLAVIERHADGEDSLVLPMRQIAREMHCSMSYAQSIVRRTACAGLILIEAQHASDGGQLANRYSLTQYGRDILDACDRRRIP